jgi:hypothetical protein
LPPILPAITVSFIVADGSVGVHLLIQLHCYLAFMICFY